jgi:hypothetical protein
MGKSLGWALLTAFCFMYLFGPTAGIVIGVIMVVATLFMFRDKDA